MIREEGPASLVRAHSGFGARARRSVTAGARALLAAALLAGAVGGCRRDAALGPADSFLVYAPAQGEGGGARRSAAGLLMVEPLAPDDPRAAALFKQLAVGFAGEVLRTDYLAKQLVRDADIGGRRYPEAARSAAREPTVLLVGGPRGEAAGQGLALRAAFGRTDERPGVVWIPLDAYPDHDRALPQTLAGLLGTAAATRVAGDQAPRALLSGYGQALEVIAREWRVGEGPAGALPADAGTAAQHALFAAVRENSFALTPGGAPRSAAELLADPGVTATVLYRLAQSKLVGRKVAGAEVYAPFVTDRIPSGVSPAAVLGPFRNFQAKLLSAWGRAVLEGRPPHDIAELVDAYARALPAEKGEVIRIFVITTYGATVKAGGVRPPTGDAGGALAELTAVAAEVAAGRLSTRAATVP
jgi:hypothetical protein